MTVRPGWKGGLMFEVKRLRTVLECTAGCLEASRRGGRTAQCTADDCCDMHVALAR